MQGSGHEEPLTDAPREYVVAHVQEAFAGDGGVAELGIGVSVAGGRLHLTGTVASAEQRERAGEVAARHSGGLDVCNDLEVVELGAPPTAERLT